MVLQHRAPLLLREVPKAYYLIYCVRIGLHSLEAKHLILVWIMKVKGPKNQADFLEVLYVVVNAWRPLGVTGPPKDENYTWFHWAP